MKYGLIAASLFLTVSASAQTLTDEAAVEMTITRMFDGMKRADTTQLTALFLPGARLQTVLNKAGTVSVRDEAIGKFIEAVGKATPNSLDERLTGVDVNIDGELATVWTSYAFYYNGQLSHCGANAFTLVKMGGNWKIQTIIDTRRKCQEVKRPDGKIEYSFIDP